MESGLREAYARRVRVMLEIDQDFRERMWALGMPADFGECLALPCVVCQRAGCHDLVYFWGDWMYHGQIGRAHV